MNKQKDTRNNMLLKHDFHDISKETLLPKRFHDQNTIAVKSKCGIISTQVTFYIRFHIKGNQKKKNKSNTECSSIRPTYIFSA